MHTLHVLPSLPTSIQSWLLYPAMLTENPTLSLASLSMIGHTLLTPLAIIKLQTQFLEKKSHATPLETEVKSLQHAIEHLEEELNLCFIHQPTIHSFSPCQSVRKVAAFLQPLFPSCTIHIQADDSTTALTVQGNHLVFQEIATILIKNACEAAQSSSSREIKVCFRLQANKLLIEFDNTCASLSWWMRWHWGRIGWSTKPGGHGIGVYTAKTLLSHFFNGNLKLQIRSSQAVKVEVLLPLFRKNVL